MKNVITTERIPIKLWLDDADENVLNQARNIANLPFTVKHIALMPDAHVGYGMPIGGVMACDDVVVPNAVGVDIGCGMCAVRTDLTEISLAALTSIVIDIRRLIPTGFKHHAYPAPMGLMPEHPGHLGLPAVTDQYEAARKQLGTLGGGNHFIEIQKGNGGRIWVMIHSGSRNVGLQVAKYYNNIAKELNRKWCVGIPPEQQLAFLPLSCNEGQQYFNEMQWCVEFAKNSREFMMKNVLGVVADNLGKEIKTRWIDIAHNYAVLEFHYHMPLVVHRKGATAADTGEAGIIPGSQGTCSYIVKGLGNPLSFKSCSHGAGRKMGRQQAKKTLDLGHEQLKMKGIVHGMNSINRLDEAPGAYKDIRNVMDNQRDLVEIVTELTPLAVMKG